MRWMSYFSQALATVGSSWRFLRSRTGPGPPAGGGGFGDEAIVLFQPGDDFLDQGLAAGAIDGGVGEFVHAGRAVRVQQDLDEGRVLVEGAAGVHRGGAAGLAEAGQYVQCRETAL